MEEKRLYIEVVNGIVNVSGSGYTREELINFLVFVMADISGFKPQIVTT